MDSGPESVDLSKILVEMKEEFNNYTKATKLQNELEGAGEVTQTFVVQKLDIAVGDMAGFLKPKKREAKANRARLKPDKVLESSTVGLKRSARRRSSETVLQSAIARKEKSYNETSKPQRLSRPLKPTKKILENIANAAMKQERKQSKKKDETVESKKKTKGKGSDLVASGENKLRTETSDNGDKKESDLIMTEDAMLGSSSDAQLIASRLCLCNLSSKMYFSSGSKDKVGCMAIDSIEEKLVGCNNIANFCDIPMFRPSARVPFMVLCNLHQSRLNCHGCCPTCGLFCTQGIFSRCSNKHQFHMECLLVVGQTECCPHCGDTSIHSVRSALEADGPALFTARQSVPHIPFDDENGESSAVANSSFEDDPMESSQYTILDLFDSIRRSDYVEIAKILGLRNIRLNTLVEYGDGEGSGTLLHYAAKYGLLPAVHMLITADTDLDLLDSEKSTALMLAVASFQDDCVKYLTKAGASVTAKGMDGMTALHLAAKCNNLAACTILISVASSIDNYIDLVDDGGWTALMWACENGHPEVVKYLLAEGADPHLRDMEQNMALHWAAFGGSCRIVGTLIKYGADVNVVNASGDTALHITSRKDHHKCVYLLLSNGAKMDVINKGDESPLDCCCNGSKSFQALSLNSELQSIITIKKKHHNKGKP